MPLGRYRDYSQHDDAELLDELAKEALGMGLFDDGGPLWEEIAKRTGRCPDTGNDINVSKEES